MEVTKWLKPSGHWTQSVWEGGKRDARARRPADDVFDPRPSAGRQEASWSRCRLAVQPVRILTRFASRSRRRPRQRRCRGVSSTTMGRRSTSFRFRRTRRVRKPAPRPLRESLARDRVRAGHAWRCLGNARRRRPEDHSLRRLSDRRLSACPTSTSASERRKGRASSRHLRTSRRIAVRCAPSFTAPVGAPACRCRGGCASLTGAAISRSRSSCLTRFLNRRRIGSSASPTGPVSPCGTSCERAGLR